MIPAPNILNIAQAIPYALMRLFLRRLRPCAT